MLVRIMAIKFKGNHILIQPLANSHTLSEVPSTLPIGRCMGYFLSWRLFMIYFFGHLAIYDWYQNTSAIHHLLFLWLIQVSMFTHFRHISLAKSLATKLRFRPNHTEKGNIKIPNLNKKFMWAIIRGNVSHHFHLNLFKTLKIYHWSCFIKITGFSKKKKTGDSNWITNS